MRRATIIAIDGPSGSGKSTAGTGLARGLGYDYINSGSIYRAVALKSMAGHLPADRGEDIARLALDTVFEIKKEQRGWRLLMDGGDVTDRVRAPDVAQASSIISVHPAVRNAVNGAIHGMIRGSTIVEGRDIGTVVFPAADVKFFITASAGARAKRRYEELKAAGIATTYEEVLRETQERDERDAGRATAPLKPAQDAIMVDTTGMTLNGVIMYLYNETRERLSQRYIDRVNDVKFYTTVSAGFCFGVKRAIDIVIRTSRQHRDIYTLGPLIHNPQEIKRLEEMGIKPVEDVSAIPSGTLIYRSHGVTSEEAENAVNKKLNIIDATCPFVTRSQRLVKALTKKGYHIVIVGDANHPEIRSLLSYTQPQRVTVVKTTDELPPLLHVRKLAVLAQTTQSMENFRRIVSALIDNVYELAVYNTICDATKIRQEESARLARLVDVMFVVGGFNSSNTNKLANICKAINPNTHHVEHQDQIKREMLIHAKKVGITAGASTPIWLIKNVLKRLKDMAKDVV